MDGTQGDTDNPEVRPLVSEELTGCSQRIGEPLMHTTGYDADSHQNVAATRQQDGE